MLPIDINFCWGLWTLSKTWYQQMNKTFRCAKLINHRCIWLWNKFSPRTKIFTLDFFGRSRIVHSASQNYSMEIKQLTFSISHWTWITFLTVHCGYFKGANLSYHELKSSRPREMCNKYVKHISLQLDPHILFKMHKH